MVKAGELLVKYGKYEGGEDLFYFWPENDCGMRRDSNLVMLAFERVPVLDDKSLRKELELRGYDITTLRFSIQKKAAHQTTGDTE